MALLDLAVVTRALVRLLELGIDASPVWGGGPPTVLPLPPDVVAAAGSDALGLYLYHCAEDPHFRNQPAPSGNEPPVRYTPMALTLFYQLSAHQQSVATANGAYLAQRLFGAALKVFHDYPNVDGSTEIAGQNVFASGGVAASEQDNRFRIALQPVPVDDAVSYWTAGSAPLRIAAYYQVSVVLLEPEPVGARAERVLAPGVVTLASLGPRVDCVTNTLAFTPPGAPAAESLDLVPAQVPVGGRFEVVGSGLDGDTVGLELTGPWWSAPADAAWGLVSSATRIFGAVADTAGGLDVIPGVYSVRVRVTRTATIPDGSAQTLALASNASPFTIGPRVSGTVVNPGGDGHVTGRLFQHADLPPDQVELCVGSTALRRVNAVPAAGEFFVASPTQLDFQLPAALPSGDARLRVFVGGAESPPRWIQVP